MQVTMQLSGSGAVVGALVGAVGRALVVLCMIGEGGGTIALLSASIGLVVGAIAGGIGRPGWGALVGCVLSAFLFELIICGFGLVLPTGSMNRDAAQMQWLTETLPYMVLMGVAGAAAGGIGGYVASTRNEQKGGATQTRTEEPSEPKL